MPEDLAALRAPEPAVNAVMRHFTAAGFRVHRDEMGLALTLEAPAPVFARVFGIRASQAAKVSAADTVELETPGEVQGLVERIVLLPKPQYF